MFAIQLKNIDKSFGKKKVLNNGLTDTLVTC